MKRLSRILFNVPAALSLVLCVATIILWRRSYSAEQQWHWEIRDTAGAVCISRGEIMFSFVVNAPDPKRKSLRPAWNAHFDTSTVRDLSKTIAGDEKIFFNWHHFALTRNSSPGDYNAHYLYLPNWFVALASLILPALRIRAFCRRRRYRKGFCKQCGYDLRATPDQCPECGTRVGSV